MIFPIEIKRNNSNTQYFQINWMLHDRCTYKCSYCAPNNYAGKDSWLDIDKVINTCKQIEDQVTIKYPSYKMMIVLGGGEPTIWKDFPSLIEYLYNKEWSLHLVTNGSRSLRWWNSLYVKWDYLGISLHPEFANIDDLIEKCNYLIDKTNLLCIRVMLHPDEILFDKAIDYAVKIEKTIPKAIIQWVPISYNFGGVDIKLPKYTEAQNSMIKLLLLEKKKHINHNYKLVTWSDGTTDIVNGNHLIASNLHNFKDWECSAGLDGIFIDSRGYINRGTCLEGTRIGHILDNNISLYDKPIICKKTSCICVTDVLYSKKKL
jgi:MoaA/NifB/PqqE/SkfB family radical SAM enzyme